MISLAFCMTLDPSWRGERRVKSIYLLSISIGSPSLIRLRFSMMLLLADN
jgi:hypothetical protein